MAAPAAEERPANSSGAKAPTDNMVRLSQYGGSLYCSIARGPDGTLHAIYTDRSEAGKPAYLFYSASHDSGTSWSEPKSLSDDESGLSAYYCRALVDGKGRVYAIWKYLTAASDSLDGPGAAACGIIGYRCLEGGTWSKVVRLATRKVPATSYFAALDSNGQVNLVWAQGNPDVDWQPKGGVPAHFGNLIQQNILDGSSPGTSKGIIVPKHIPTEAEIAAAHAAGKDIPYEDRSPKRDGLWNLRGYIDAAGVPHFVADHYPMPKDRFGNTGGYVLMYFDGKQLHRLLEQASGLNLNNPPTLLLDSRGKEHLLRKPEKTEKECVRDYTIENGELGDSVDVIAPTKAPGKVTHWQATPLLNGQIAVTASLSQKGGFDPDDLELYLSISSGEGQWSKPVCVTDNVARQAFASHETSAGGVLTSTRYRPDFAETVDLGGGHVGILMVNTAKSIIGITQSGVTPSGRPVGSLATGSTATPWVFFRRF